MHLWHPPAPRNDRWIGNGHNWALCMRYAATRHDPAAMLALIAEAHRMLQHRTYEAGGLS